jgi:hypothetical protein
MLTGMDMIYIAAEVALMAYESHWRRSYIEHSHGMISRQRSTHSLRALIAQQEADIEDIIRELWINTPVNAKH